MRRHQLQTLMHTFLRSLCLWLVMAGYSHAYSPELHQELTFTAAKAANRCLEQSAIPRLTALQVRYLVKANVGMADRNMFARMFRWNYYDRADMAERSTLWVVDTRMHEHFNDLVLRIGREQSAPRRYSDLGRVLGYLQDVTTPSRAVPVFTNRFWRLSFSDRFDDYPADSERISAALADRCAEVLAPQPPVEEILHETAAQTLEAVQAQIFGLPVTWQAFWTLADEEDDFGEFGPAGNSFGRETVFPCPPSEERCVLLDDDPLYAQFAFTRHVAAVLATMRVLVLMQRDQQPPTWDVNAASNR